MPRPIRAASLPRSALVAVGALAAVVAAVLLALSLWVAPGNNGASPEPAGTVDPQVVRENVAQALAPPSEGAGGDGEGAEPPKTTEPSIADVELGAGVTEADLASLGVDLGFTVRHYLPQIGFASIESLDGEPIPESTLAQLTQRGAAKSAEPTGWAQVASTAPTDPRYVQQWGFNNSGQTGGVSGADINAEAAWDWSRGDDVVVAVVDEGVMTTHPDLASKMWVNPGEVAGNGVDDDANGYIDDINGWDFYNDDATVYDSYDGDMHGTHVAGTIAAATNNGAGGAGTAWNAKIMSVKALGPLGGAYSDLAAAIVYAVDNGAPLSNNSWGGSTNSSLVAAAVSYAQSNDHLMLCAAGNNATNNDSIPYYPAAYTSPNVIAVASHDAADNISSFSNYGASSVDIAAPGSAILSTRAASTAAVRVMNRTATNGTAPYSLYYYSFPVERLGNYGQTTTRNALIDTALTNLAPSTATSVLVVNDSWNIYGDFTGVYTGRLSALGYSSVNTTTTWSGTTPVAPNVSGYGMVVWFTDLMSVEVGGSSKMTLTEAERTALGNYLNGGGKLLLVSAEFAKDVATYSKSSGLPWALEYTRTRLFADTHQNNFAGISGSAFSGMNGATFDWLLAPTGQPADYYSFLVGDGLAPQPGADRLLYWTSQYFSMNGTSMATPHVTGAAALAWARTPGATAAEIRQRILSTATPVASLAGKVSTGGRLNAAGAVGRTAPPTDLAAQATASDGFTASWVNDTADAYFAQTKVLARLGEPVAGGDDSAATVLHAGTGTSAAATGVDSGTWYLSAFSRNDFGMWSEESSATVVLGPLVESPEGDLAEEIVVTFPSWNASGTVSALLVNSPPSAPPKRKIPVGLCYDITTDVGYTGPATVTLYYGDSPDALEKESSIRLFHYEGGAWVDITDSVDTTAKTVTGTASSFSPFAIMVDADVYALPVPAADPWAIGLVVVAGLALSGWAIRRREAA